MNYKFNVKYLSSIPRDEFIHWTGVHIGPGTGKWGFNKGHVWNEQLQQFLKYNPKVKFIDDNEEPYISRYFNEDIIIATNQDFGILRVTDKNIRGIEGTINNQINNFLSRNKLNVNLNTPDLYVCTSPEPNGGNFPWTCDVFNEPQKVRRIYSKGLMCTDNPKFRPLPNGLCNITIDPIRDKIFFDEEKRIDNLVVYNFRLGTNEERDKILNYFNTKDWATEGKGKQTEYLREMYHHKFVISPESCCADSHRTWEAMYLGAIPIVQKTPGMSWFEDLPILQVDDMCSLTKEFLEEKYEEMMSKEYNLDKLKISYWLSQIKRDIYEA
tara:strand:- start:1974 stop:2951 length:978 start_codon:yes stop_codon:yes gene_type:complete